ncbi:hypothetical protein chiPu_0018790 [Chiloscyllium punctatum]|uniref:Uncharacterized protein n=1 Tax=Chiloscyllium punctatum TaxID=137246 RepID=A0A401RPY4_CHIPU|nr:hypothetical protein [Chiloscyllium punctatum]
MRNRQLRRAAGEKRACATAIFIRPLEREKHMRSCHLCRAPGEGEKENKAHAQPPSLNCRSQQEILLSWTGDGAEVAELNSKDVGMQSDPAIFNMKFKGGKNL